MSVGRKKKIEKYLRGKTWWIHFYIGEERMRKSLKTDDETIAEYRKNEIFKITKFNIPNQVAISKDVVEIVFEAVLA